MAQNPLTMEVIKQMLRLKQDGIGIRETARRLGISRNSVKKYLSQLQDIPTDETDLSGRIFNTDCLAHDEQRMTDLAKHLGEAVSDLSKTGVTRQLIWQEYLDKHPDGYSYSRYCYHLQQYLKNRDLTMHLEYSYGDVLMIDFAGKKQSYTDPDTGELVACEVFVSILPASGLIFCKAVPTQRSADFVSCINDMLRFYGGVPYTILCDNLKTAVIRPNRYEPLFTELCEQLSDHYLTTFSATRPYSPRDKAMVESAVRIVYAHVYAPLRHEVFTGIRSLNDALSRQLQLLNDKPYKKTPFSRRYYFEKDEQSQLRELPAAPFPLRHTTQLTVQRNYHIQLSENRRYYSVPFQHVGQKVKVYYDNQTVEVFLNGNRIALHQRSGGNKAYTTLGEHMPPNHHRMQQIRGYNKDDLLAMAERIGQSTRQAANLLLQNSIYIEQNYKACYGMLMLGKKYTDQRLEAACLRVLEAPRVNYTLIKNILERKLDQCKSPEKELFHTPDHENIRGKEAYQ